MPYIKQELREQIDQAINLLASSISHAAITQNPVSIDAQLPGILNYTITSLINSLYGLDEIRYQHHNSIIGMLECCKQEFYRRATAPYEDKCIEKNGDVFPKR